MIVKTIQLIDGIYKVERERPIFYDEIISKKDSSDFHNRLFECITILLSQFKSTVYFEVIYIVFLFDKVPFSLCPSRIKFGIRGMNNCSLSFALTGELGRIDGAIVKPLLKSDAQLILDCITSD